MKGIFQMCLGPSPQDFNGGVGGVGWEEQEGFFLVYLFFFFTLGTTNS